MKDLYLLDASGYLYRSYFAIPPMTNEKGESTNALFGFIRSVIKLQKDFNPENLVAVFDGPKSAIRREEIYPEYKANREKGPDDLYHQIQWAKEFCELVGLPFLSISEVEADDTMASIVKWGQDKVDHIYVCTSDKDLCQVVSNKVSILNTHKENLIIDPKKVEEIHGVPPEKIGDLLAIMGDSSDNVPGLPGFGPKTAATLLQAFGSLEYILNHPEEVPGKKKQETLMQERELAEISRKLVTLFDDVEIPENEDFYQIKRGNNENLMTFYREKSFNSLLKEVSEEVEEKTSYTLVDDERSFVALMEQLSKEKEICFDTETTALLPLEAELVGVGFATKKGQAWYVPTNGTLGKERVLKGIKPLLENPLIGFYGHHIKYDYQVMGNYGIAIENICFDTLLASYLLNAHKRSHSLDQLTLEYFGKVKIPTSDLIGKGKKMITMAEVPIPTVSNYCCEDVDYTCRLKTQLEQEIQTRGLKKLLHELEIPLLKVLAKMERDGIYLDANALKAITEPVLEKIQQVKEEIFHLAGEEFNLNSPKQLSEILFEKLGIKSPKKSSSTSADVLMSLQQEYPIAEKVLTYRTLEKLRSTYLEILPTQINKKTGRIHCTFNQSVTATGRLSCQDPNLQNIPVRTEIGREIRGAFRPEQKGYSYLSADYSQVELRLLAHLCEDPHLLEAFQNNQDIHAHTAAKVFHVPLNQVTKEMRSRAKAVNFGIIYGQQAFGLARELGIDVKEAEAFIKTYFTQYPTVKEFLKECKERAKKTGKAVTFTGRERPIPEMSSPNFQIRLAAERLAVNTPIQGTAADIIKMAMLRIDQKLKDEGLRAFMILQIHDELIFEAPDEEIPRLTSLVKEEMENVIPLKIPLIVDIHVGKNWKEC